MVQKIALFNHKGGVGRTTTTFNLGWMLASKGKRVILVDTDPQCNLTGMVLKKNTEEDELRIENIYNTRSNIKIGLASAFESQTRAIEAVDCIDVKGQEGLFLLPGHVGFTEYEVILGIAQQLNGSIQTLKNLPGAISNLLEKTANKFNADYILIDMGSSLGAINQNILMTSDFFLVPTTADFFSMMAIDSMSRILPKWCSWAKIASKNPILKQAAYQFPKFRLKFLGIIVQNYTTIRDEKTVVLQTLLEEIENTITKKLKPILEKNNLLLPEQIYIKQGINDSFIITKISDFNSLITISQKYSTPIYNLNAEQLGDAGIVRDNNQKKQEEFRKTFSDLADKIIALSSSYAISA